MKRLLFLTPILFLFLAASCAQKSVEPADYSLVIGSQGGFAGSYTAWHINGATGAVSLKRTVDQDLTHIKTLDRETLVRIFEEAQYLRLTKRNLFQRGNMVSFMDIEYRGRNNLIQWDVGAPIDSDLRAYYKWVREKIEAAPEVAE